MSGSVSWTGWEIKNALLAACTRRVVTYPAADTIRNASLPQSTTMMLLPPSREIFDWAVPFLDPIKYIKTRREKHKLQLLINYSIHILTES